MLSNIYSTVDILNDKGDLQKDSSRSFFGVVLRSCPPLKVLGPHPATYGLGPEDRLQRGHQVVVCGFQLSIYMYIHIIYIYVHIYIYNFVTLYG